jgi:hypothetical protein
VFAFSGSEFFVVLLERQPAGVKLANYVKAYIDATFRFAKVRPERQSNISVDGRPGKLLEYHLKINGENRFSIVALTLTGRNGYLVDVVAAPGDEQGARGFFTTLLGTFTITG